MIAGQVAQSLVYYSALRIHCVAQPIFSSFQPLIAKSEIWFYTKCFF